MAERKLIRKQVVPSIVYSMDPTYNNARTIINKEIAVLFEKQRQAGQLSDQDFRRLNQATIILKTLSDIERKEQEPEIPYTKEELEAIARRG